MQYCYRIVLLGLTTKPFVFPLGWLGEINAERAAYLSRLEVEWQLKRFQRVEWSHDVDERDTEARLAAAALMMSRTSGLQFRAG